MESLNWMALELVDEAIEFTVLALETDEHPTLGAAPVGQPSVTLAPPLNRNTSSMK